MLQDRTLIVYVWLDNKPVTVADVELPAVLTFRLCPDRSGIPVAGSESVTTHSSSKHPISKPGDDGKLQRTSTSFGESAVASREGTGPGGSDSTYNTSI